ncbi:MAG: type II secretion system protein GspN [Deltaproteobacteria bacterium]|nr:type II secretion system protein GspN [Deltaproteobacteria bacterium]
MSYWKLVDWRRRAADRRWLWPALGTVAFAAVVFLVALRYLFPYADVARWMEAKLRTAGFEARVEGLGPGSLIGAEARSIVLSPGGVTDRRTELRDVSLRLSLLSLLQLRPKAVLEAQGIGGTVQALITLREPMEVDAQWENLDLSRAPLPPEIYSLGLGGRFTGTLRATLFRSTNGAEDVTGTLDGRVASAKLGPGNLHGLPLPGVSLGTGQLQLRAAQGRIQVQTVRFEGGNLDVSLNGRIDLPQGARQGAVQGLLSLRPRGRTEEDLGFLLAFFPGPRASDGTYTAQLGGNLGALVLSPATATR